jgi:hypothetical protein
VVTITLRYLGINQSLWFSDRSPAKSDNYQEFIGVVKYAQAMKAATTRSKKRVSASQNLCLMHHNPTKRDPNPSERGPKTGRRMGDYLSRSLATVSLLFSRERRPCPICLDLQIGLFESRNIYLDDLRRRCRGCTIISQGLNLLAHNMGWKVPSGYMPSVNLSRQANGPLILGITDNLSLSSVYGVRIFADPY